jgi:hypothetical protein
MASLRPQPRTDSIPADKPNDCLYNGATFTVKIEACFLIRRSDEATR